MGDTVWQRIPRGDFSTPLPPLAAALQQMPSRQPTEDEQMDQLTGGGMLNPQMQLAPLGNGAGGPPPPVSFDVTGIAPPFSGNPAAQAAYAARQQPPAQRPQPAGQPAGPLTPERFEGNLRGGSDPNAISLGDVNNWLTAQGTNWRPSYSTPLVMPDGSLRQAPDDNPMAQRLQGLQAFQQTAANAGNIRTQAGDLALRQLEALGLPAGMMQGSVGGRIQNDAARTGIAQEQHADTLSRQTRIDQAVMQYMQQNPRATQQEVARFRANAERNIPATNPLVDALGSPSMPGRVPGGPPGSITPPVPGGVPTTNPANPSTIAPRGAQSPPPGTPWDGVSDRLDQEWQRILQTYGSPTSNVPNAPSQINPNQRDDAIADLVNSLGGDFVNQNIQSLHPYLINRFGGTGMDSWFTARQGLGANNPSSRARQTLINALNARGANIGMSSLNPQSPATMRFGSAQGIGNMLGDLLRPVLGR